MIRVNHRDFKPLSDKSRCTMVFPAVKTEPVRLQKQLVFSSVELIAHLTRPQPFHQQDLE